jgi:hypothetical protein
VPISTLPVALTFLRGAPGAPPEAALRHATAVAYAKADALLVAGGEPHSLTRDEIAAANLYTQDGWPAGPVRSLFRPLNAALRGEARTDVKAYWGYIRLLQHALFKLPKDESGTLFRGIKLDWPGAPTPVAYMADMLRKQRSGEEEIWWAFSSTSTSLPAVRRFLGEQGPRVIFTVDGGSSARDVRRYSGFQEGATVPEDERLLPCGTAFVVKTADLMGEDLLMVSLRQTDDVLIQGGAPAQPPPLHEAVAGAPEPEPAAEAEPEPAATTAHTEGSSYSATPPPGGGGAAIDLIRHGDLTDVISVLKQHIQDAAITRACCNRLSNLVRRNPAGRDEFCCAGLAVVLSTVSLNGDSPRTQAAALECLWNACHKHPANSQAVRRKVAVVARAMMAHPDDERLQGAAMGLLSNLGGQKQDPQLQLWAHRELLRVGGVGLVLAPLSRFPEAQRLQENGIMLIGEMTLCDVQLGRSFVVAQATTIVEAAQARYVDDARVQESCEIALIVLRRITTKKK